jgi:hypothetical protein
LKNKIENDQEIIDEKREKHNLEFEVERDMRYVVGYRAYRKIRNIIVMSWRSVLLVE